MTTQGNKCPVCLKLFDDPRWMPCKHIYCFKCIPRLHRRDKNQIVLECRICAMQHQFRDWSTVKYYATLYCVPYLTALQFDNTSRSSSTIKTSCPACFNVIRSDSMIDSLEYCSHCNKKVCHQCLMGHRDEMKKNILYVNNQCRLFMGRNQQYAKQTINKLENMKMHIDSRACELIDQVDTYYDSVLAQIDEQKFNEESNSSSGYESLIEQRLAEVNHDVNQRSNSEKKTILTDPSIVPVRNLIGELISPDSSLSISSFNSSTSRLLWSMTYSFHPSHLAFDPNSSKLFICNDHGFVSVYKYTKSNVTLVNTFYLHHDKKSQPINIKSLVASPFSLIVILNSLLESILHLYSHNGLLLQSLSFFNEYITQIRLDNNYLWCLELISSSLFYLTFQSNHLIDDKISKRKQFVSFQQQSFYPFRFSLNQFFVAVLDRASTGIILLFNKHTTSYVKQIKSPLTNFQPCDIELTNQMLIFRFPHMIILTQLEDETEDIERINANKNINLVIGKCDTEFLLSTPTDDSNTFIIQCYVK